jgi:hypothetical protein
VPSVVRAANADVIVDEVSEMVACSNAMSRCYLVETLETWCERSQRSEETRDSTLHMMLCRDLCCKSRLFVVRKCTDHLQARDHLTLIFSPHIRFLLCQVCSNAECMALQIKYSILLTH